jgi:hypothetical protein
MEYKERRQKLTMDNNAAQKEVIAKQIQVFNSYIEELVGFRDTIVNSEWRVASWAVISEMSTVLYSLEKAIDKLNMPKD